jgi:hypothetical protein
MLLLLDSHPPNLSFQMYLHGGLQADVRTRQSGLTTHGGGLQADDVRTRQSGLTTHGRQDVRTRQSGLTTSQKPVILSQGPFFRTTGRAYTPEWSYNLSEICHPFSRAFLARDTPLLVTTP